MQIQIEYTYNILSVAYYNSNQIRLNGSNGFIPINSNCSIRVVRPILSAFRAEDRGSNPLSSIMSKELVDKLNAKNTEEDKEEFKKLMSKSIKTDMTYEEFKNNYSA